MVYKQAKWQGTSAATNLQTRLSDALRQKPDATDRMQMLSGGNHYRVLNYNTTDKGLFFGEVFAFKQGDRAPTADIHSSKKVFNVASIETGDANSEFIERPAYFGVLGDNVVVCQSASMRTVSLEKYLQWLLFETGSLTGIEAIELADRVISREDAFDDPPKSLVLFNSMRFETLNSNGKGEVTTHPMPPDEPTAAVAESKILGKALDALKAMLPEGMKLPETVTADNIALVPKPLSSVRCLRLV